MPGLRDDPREPLDLLQALRFAAVGQVEPAERGGDGVVLLHQRAPDDLGGMRGQHELDRQPAEALHQLGGAVAGLDQPVDDRGQRIRVRVARDRAAVPADLVVLLGDVGEIQELVERARHVHQPVPRQAGEVGAQGLPVRLAAADVLRERADRLDGLEEVGAPIRLDHLAEQLAQQADVLAQLRGELLGRRALLGPDGLGARVLLHDARLLWLPTKRMPARFRADSRRMPAAGRPRIGGPRAWRY